MIKTDATASLSYQLHATCRHANECDSHERIRWMNFKKKRKKNKEAYKYEYLNIKVSIEDMGILKKKKKIMRNIKINRRIWEKRNKVTPTLDEMRKREGIKQCIET